MVTLTRPSPKRYHGSKLCHVLETLADRTSTTRQEDETTHVYFRDGTYMATVETGEWGSISTLILHETLLTTSTVLRALAALTHDSHEYKSLPKS